MWNTNCSFCKICICLTLSNPSAFNECTAISIQFLASLGRIRAQEHYKVLLFSFFFILWNEVTHASHHVNLIPTLQNAPPCQRHHTWWQPALPWISPRLFSSQYLRMPMAHLILGLTKNINENSVPFVS